MIRGDDSDSDSIPIDLILEIHSRLPGKSIARFRCVSKLWGSMLLCPYFNELFLTRSSSRPPRLLFAVEQSDGWCFFSSPQKPYDESSSSSLVVAADFQMKIHGDNKSLQFCGHASGFIHVLRHMHMSGEDKDPVPVPVICNPTTEQYVSLHLPLPPIRGMNSVWRSFLGFDPIDKQFKVLSTRRSSLMFVYPFKKEDTYQILTLGTRNDSWRKIHCPLHHFPHKEGKEGICINGVLYYLAENGSSVLVCFDIRFETFKFIYRDFIRYYTKLINYKGKVGVINLEGDHNPHSPGFNPHSTELCMWVIKDVEKPESSEWLKYVYICCLDEIDIYNLSIDGVTATGEIVLSTKHAYMSFYVYFLNPEKNTLQRIEIQGFGNPDSVKVVADYVEDLKFVTMKTTYDHININIIIYSSPSTTRSS